MGKDKKRELKLGDDVWQQYIPIIKSNKHTYDIYLQDAIESPAIYNEVCHVLSTSTKKDKINLHINTPGGYLDTAFRLVEAIDDCKAETTAILTGTVASAGTLIALRCDKLKTPSHLQFMIHNYSGGTSGKGNEIIEHVTFSNAEITRSFNTVYLGFLSKKEIKRVIAGTDMWMDAKDVKHRWKVMKRRG